MRGYWAIIKDSYREALDSKILLFLLAISSIIIGLVAGIGWWKYESYELTLGERNGRARVGVTVVEKDGALIVRGIDRQGPAGETKLAVETQILSLDDTEVTTRDDFRKVLEGKQPGQSLVIKVREPGASFLWWQASRTGSELDGLILVPTDLKMQLIQSLLANWILGFFGVIVGLIVTAGFMPRFLETGAIHLVMARPVTRWGVICAKYLGGLTFMVLLAAYLLGGVWAAISVRSGLYDAKLLWAVPILVLAFAQLYAISVFFSLLSRSQIVTIVGSVLFYLIAILFNWVYHSPVERVLISQSPTAMALTPDGRRLSVKPLVTFDPEKSVVQFNASKGAETGAYGTALAGLQPIPFQRGDERTFYAMKTRGSLVVVDQYVRQIVGEINVPAGRASAFRVGPKASTVLIETDSDLAVWDLTGKVRRRDWPRPKVEVDGTITALDYDGSRVAVGLDAGQVLLLDAQNGTILKQWTSAHTDVVRGVALLDGRIISAGEDGLLLVHEADKDAPVHRVAGLGPINGMDLHRRTRALAIWTSGPLVDTFRLDETGRPVHLRGLRGPGGEVVLATWSGSGEHLAIAGRFGQFAVVSGESGDLIGTLDNAPTARKFRTAMNVFYWLLPRTNSLDQLTNQLMSGEKLKEFRDQQRRPELFVEVSPWRIVGNALLYIVGVMALTSFLFSRRDL